MLISICIPHYNRSRYLLAVLDSIVCQDYPELEVVISDDCSTDDSNEVVPAYVAGKTGATPIRFRYIRQERNLGYDGNVRAVLAAGSGEYLFILGNDDALASPGAISSLVRSLQALDQPDVAFTNYHMYGHADQPVRRAYSTRLIGSGVDVALAWFRAFSYVAGIVIRREAFQLHDTPDYDGSIYIQIYLAARIIAAGGRLATIEESMVAKDVVVEGKLPNSYADTLAAMNRRFTRKTGGLDQVGRVACDAILPFVGQGRREAFLVAIYRQILTNSYAFWLWDYRSKGAFKAAVNLALGCWPGNLIKTETAAWTKIRISITYILVSLAGLFAPLSLLARLKDILRKRREVTANI